MVSKAWNEDRLINASLIVALSSFLIALAAVWWIVG